MTSKNMGSIGYQVPWKQVEGAFMRVDHFLGMSEIVDGRIESPGALGDYGLASVEILIVDPAMRNTLIAQTGGDSLWLGMPLKNQADYRLFYWVYEVRHVGDEEEVWTMYFRPGFLKASKGSLSLAIFPKGAMASAFEASGATNRPQSLVQPDIKPIWSHQAGQKFVAPGG